MNDKNPAYYQAANDYCPALAVVNYEAISQLTPPVSSSLQGHGLAVQDPNLWDNALATTVYILAMNSLNYQFWDLTPDNRMTRYAHEGNTGAVALGAGFAALWAAAAPQCPITRGTLELCIQNLRSDVTALGLPSAFGDIPARASRVRLLKEMCNPARLLNVAEHLVNRMKFEGELSWVDAQYLANLFPLSYEDPYLKKAQLALMLIAGQWHAVHGSEIHLDVSAAADYQLPKVLRALGLLTYSEELAHDVDAGTPLPVESDKERAIRAATLHACDALAQHFGTGIQAVDFWLWSQRNVAANARFHLTETTWY